VHCRVLTVSGFLRGFLEETSEYLFVNRAKSKKLVFFPFGRNKMSGKNLYVLRDASTRRKGRPTL
jgi:hypothetical protein